MTCRIDRRSIEQGIVLRISGRIAAEGIDVLRAALTDGGVVALDLTEVELVDRDAVMLLATSEARGIELRNCPTYIREWVTRERESSSRRADR
jgi:anti-anti-sigma regulatory factor